MHPLLLIATLAALGPASSAAPPGSTPRLFAERVRCTSCLSPEATTALPVPVTRSSQAWGDVDNDGDLDLILTGSTTGDWNNPVPTTRLYRNDGSFNFTDITPDLPQIWNANVTWCDYNNDGLLDLLLIGQTGAGFVDSTAITDIYRNNGDLTFSRIASGLPRYREYSNAAWGDYDNDGLQDVLISGRLATEQTHVGLYHNNGDGTLSELIGGFQSAGGGVTWADLDSDGYLDFVSEGPGWWGGPGIERNNHQPYGFKRIWDFPAFAASYGGPVSVADYDNDGALDMLVVNTVTGVHLFRNLGAFVFEPPPVDSVFVNGDPGRWADYDNDGDPDLLLPGGGSIWVPPYGPLIYNVLFGNYGDQGFAWDWSHYPPSDVGDAGWADMNNDGRIDFLITGEGTGPGALIGMNEVSRANTPPSVPTGLAAQVGGGGVRLSWNGAVDNETPSTGLTYNLRVGTTAGGCDVVSPMADPVGGYRRVVDYGNVQRGTAWQLDVPSGTYYWSVQAVDGAYAGGAWASEASFTAVTAVEAGIGGTLKLGLGGRNPCAGDVILSLWLPRGGHASLKVYDVAGREVVTLLAEEMARGGHLVSWRPNDGRGDRARGVYLARLRLESEVRMVKLVIL